EPPYISMPPQPALILGGSKENPEAVLIGVRMRTLPPVITPRCAPWATPGLVTFDEAPNISSIFSFTPAAVLAVAPAASSPTRSESCVFFIAWDLQIGARQSRAWIRHH